MGARVRVVAPPTLLPADVERLGVEAFHDMTQGLDGCDIVMMLRLQKERMQCSFVTSIREYFTFSGLTRVKLAAARSAVRVLHPGPVQHGRASCWARACPYV